MKKIAVLALLCICLLLGGCKATTKAVKENSPLLIGVWQMTAYVQDAGESYDFTDKNVLFTYLADGTGVKTVDGELEYNFTYSYDGENLYTTAAYPNGRIGVMHDLSTVQGDTLTTYSYDEKATITLKKQVTAPTPAPTTAAKTN